MTILSLIYFNIQLSTHEWTDTLIYFEWFWFWDRHDDHDLNDGTLHHFTFLRPSLARSTETSPKVDPVWPCTDQKSGWVALSRRAFEIFETREDRKMWWRVHASAVSGQKAPWNMAHSACSLCLCCQCFAVKTWRLVFKWVEQFEHDILFEYIYIDVQPIWIQVTFNPFDQYLNVILIYTILYTVPVHISTTWSSYHRCAEIWGLYPPTPLCHDCGLGFTSEITPMPSMAPLATDTWKKPHVTHMCYAYLCLQCRVPLNCM